MNDSSNRDVEVFTEAIRLPPAEHAAYLERVCGSDFALRRRVEALLKGSEQMGDFLEDSPQTIPLQAGTAAVAGEKPGDHIGRYKLLQQIGEGGCGVVFMAEQEEPVRRRVALKIIKAGMDTRSVIARFEAERQALALMDHPNIAKVFDAGATDSGRPYFVMELIRGIKITEYCDQHALTTEQRLKLFLQVCQAVQHAHQKGIIHRDIKPSNILVTQTEQSDPLPVVIDFGIAKATTNQQLTDKTLFTAFEMLIGTPAYMSPEQAALTSVDVDTRTDIYSLGVLLYELLTGSTPFDTGELLKAGLDEIRRVIRDQEPVRPSTRLSNLAAADLTTVAQYRHSEPPTLIRAVRGDLDWIVMKALEKDRTRRYPTANGLALDIQSFLANEAISARPPSKIYKARKIIERNKLFFFGIALVFILLVVSLITTTRWLIMEKGAREQLRLRIEIARMDEKGWGLYYQGRFSEAAPQLIKALVLRRQLPKGETTSPILNHIVIIQAYDNGKNFGKIRPFIDEFVDQSLLTRPGYKELMGAATDMLMRRQRWNDAAALTERLRIAFPKDSDLYHKEAPLLVAGNNLEGYRLLCQNIVSQFSNTTDPLVADKMAKDCLILPSSGVDLKSVAALADVAVSRGSNTTFGDYFQCCKALADFRQGHFEEAAKGASLETTIVPLKAAALAIKAMSLFQLGRSEEARIALADCDEIIKSWRPNFEEDSTWMEWQDWFIARALHDEAETLGQGGYKSGKDPQQK